MRRSTIDEVHFAEESVNELHLNSTNYLIIFSFFISEQFISEFPTNYSNLKEKERTFPIIIHSSFQTGYKIQDEESKYKTKNDPGGTIRRKINPEKTIRRKINLEKSIRKEINPEKTIRIKKNPEMMKNYLKIKRQGL